MYLLHGNACFSFLASQPHEGFLLLLGGKGGETDLWSELCSTPLATTGLCHTSSVARLHLRPHPLGANWKLQTVAN